MDLLAWSWREGVLLLAGLVVIYVVVMFVRLLRVGKSGAPRRPVERRAPSMAMPLAAEAAAPRGEPTTPRDEPPQPLLSTLLGRDPAPRPTPGENDFAAELARSNLEVEVQQLRRETLGLRQQVAALEQELLQLKARSNVSPLYSEAMSLAQRGVPADGIAGQCGISLGEAELVAALARGETGAPPHSNEDQHGQHPGPGRRTGTHG